ncbi:MAG: DUF927 domain-containing protein [Clostridia bacterium]|nr:DUF927 domain-containing protein [Clostridia bacterium]
MNYDDKIKERFAKIPQYKASAKDLWLRTGGTPDNPQWVHVANGTVLLNKIINYNDGFKTEERLELITVYQGEYSKKHTIPAEKLTSSKFESAAPTVGFSIDSTKKLIDSIHAQAPYCTVQDTYTHTGWAELDGKLAFLHAGGAVGSNKPVTVELDGGLSNYRFSAENHADKWDVFKQLVKVAPKRIMYPLLAFAALSPLLFFLRNEGLKQGFLMFLYGKTNTGKTTLAALVLSLFGSFVGGELPASFQDTALSIPKKAQLLADVLMVVDDFHPTANRKEYERMSDTVQKLSRAYGNHTGRSRLTADIEMGQQHIPMGNALLTGEMYPDIGESGFSRMVTIEVKPGDINFTTLSEVQEKADRLSECMREYVSWLAVNGNGYSSLMKQEFIKQRASVQGSGYGRTAEQIAYLMVSVKMALIFLKDQKVITGEGAAAEIANTALNLFIEWSKEQTASLKSNDPCIMFLTELDHLIQTNGISFLNDHNSALDRWKGGYQDDEYYYLAWKTVSAKITQSLQQRNSRLPVDFTTLKKRLAEGGYIIPGKNGKPDKQKRFGDKTLWVVFLKKAALDNLPD